MFWALAVILLAFAGFTVLVMRRRQPSRCRTRASTWTSSRASSTSAPGRWPGLAVAVVIVGLVAAPNGIAEGLAVLGFFGYLLYLVAATVVLYVAARHS